MLVRLRVAMSLLTYIIWVLGPLLETALLLVMVRRGARSRFPRFFAYVLFQVLKSAILFLVYHFYSYDSDNYFYAYWTGNALSVLLSMSVLDEIWRSLFRGYEGIQSLGSTLFRWACAVMILIAIVGAATFQQSSADRVLTAVLALDRNMRQMQCGVFLLVLLLCRFFKNFWRDQVFGIALGFGIFAAVELALVTILSRFGIEHIASVSLIKSMAFTSVLVVWIGYLKRPEPVLERMPSQLGLWNNVLLAQPSVSSNQPFLTMVEDAVERVLSRTRPWPRSASKGSRLLCRRPGAEDCN
jgi:hypothetical protein